MKRILIVINNFDAKNGIAQFVLNYYNDLANYDNLCIDLLVEDSSSLKDDKHLFHSKINFVTITELKENPILYIKDWYNLAKNLNETYDYVHFHLDNLVHFISLALLRKKKGVIIHSHNSSNDFVKASKIKRIMHATGKRIVKRSNFFRFACSSLAAKWLFGDSKFTQVNNGIDLEKFKFQQSIREKYRNQWDLNNKIVYGHVGRFVNQKNHKRLIEIFENIYQKQQDAVLVLIGNGNLESQIKDIVKAKQLDSVVHFLGMRQDVDSWLNVFDYIVFPSYYEGLPLSLIEAQANGIPVYYSDSITKEVQVLDSSYSFSLEDTSANIANNIVNNQEIAGSRENASTFLKQKGYEKLDVVQWLYHFYQGEN